MYAILLSAGQALLGFFLRGATLKFVILSFAAYLFSWLINAVTSAIDISPLTGIQTLIDALPPAVLFFMGVFRMDVGLPLCLAAMATKFLIRRLPIIG